MARGDRRRRCRRRGRRWRRRRPGRSAASAAATGRRVDGGGDDGGGGGRAARLRANRHSSIARHEEAQYVTYVHTGRAAARGEATREGRRGAGLTRSRVGGGVGGLRLYGGGDGDGWLVFDVRTAPVGFRYSRCCCGGWRGVAWRATVKRGVRPCGRSEAGCMIFTWVARFIYFLRL